MKFPKWPNLTARELCFLGAALLFGAFFVGSIVARLLDGHDLNWDAISAIGTLFGALVTFIAVVLAVFGYRQTQETHRAEFRALLRIDIEVFDWWRDRPFRLELVAHNSGRTPATAVRGDVRLIWYDASTEPMRELSRVRFVVWSQDVQPAINAPLHISRPPHEPFPGVTWEDVNLKSAQLFVFAEVPYKDEFGKEHTAKNSATYGVVISPSDPTRQIFYTAP